MILDDIITHLTNTITALESRDQLKGEGLHVLLHVYWTLISTLYKAVRNNNNGKYIVLLIDDDVIIRRWICDQV